MTNFATTIVYEKRYHGDHSRVHPTTKAIHDAPFMLKYDT